MFGSAWALNKLGWRFALPFIYYYEAITMFKQDFIGYNYVSKVLRNISIFICLPKIFEHMKDDTMPQPAPICFVYALKMFALEPINTFNF